MKSIALLLAMISATVIATPAMAGGAFSHCKALEQRLATSAVNFVKIKSDHSLHSTTEKAGPAALYRNTVNTTAQLQTAADQVWDLRSEMVNSRCSQASGFTY